MPKKSVVAGHAAFRYSLMRPSQWVVLMICVGGGGEGGRSSDTSEQGPVVITSQVNANDPIFGPYRVGSSSSGAHLRSARAAGSWR